MSKVESIYPSNDFKVVAKNAGNAIKIGMVIGYDHEGELSVYGGGLLHGKQPTAKDWLWLLESVRHKLINGDFSAV